MSKAPSKISRKGVPQPAATEEELAEGTTSTAPPDTPQGPSNVPEDAPPGYSGPSVSVAPPQPRRLITPGMPDVDITKYFLKNSTISKERTTRTVQDAALCSDPGLLERFIYEQAALPPHPQVVITGTHSEHGTRRIDFDVRLSLIRYIVRPDQDRWNYVRTASEGEKVFRGGKTESAEPAVRGGAREWIQMFCKESSMAKTFILTRDVVNLDKAFIDGQIRTLLASINYRGTVAITFPSTHQRVVIQPPPKLNQLFSALVSPFVASKTFETVTAVWPFASTHPASRHDGHQPTTWAVQSEAAWLSDWRHTIAEAAMAGRQGWLTLEDQFELAMGATGETRKIKPWGIES